MKDRLRKVASIGSYGAISAFYIWATSGIFPVNCVDVLNGALVVLITAKILESGRNWPRKSGLILLACLLGSAVFVLTYGFTFYKDSLDAAAFFSLLPAAWALFLLGDALFVGFWTLFPLVFKVLQKA